MFTKTVISIFNANEIVRLFIILVLGFMLIPAYAQETKDVDEVKSSLDDIFNIIVITVIASIIGSFVGGSVLGYVFSNRIENNREEKDLNKLHTLIKSDFSMINRFITNSEITLNSYKKAFEEENYANRIVEELNTMTAESHDTKIYGKFIQDVRLTLILSYKNTIELNGLLIKLEPDEIKIIQTTYDSIINHEKLIQNDWEP